MDKLFQTKCAERGLQPFLPFLETLYVQLFQKSPALDFVLHLVLATTLL